MLHKDTTNNRKIKCFVDKKLPFVTFQLIDLAANYHKTKAEAIAYKETSAYAELSSAAKTEYDEAAEIIERDLRYTEKQLELVGKKGKYDGKLIVSGAGSISELLAKFNNLTITEAKNLYSQLIKSEIIGSKTAVTQSTILAEINASNTLVNPYNFAHSIDDIILNQEALFVRVHNSWNPNRPWLISIEEFRTFTNQDAMIKKLALPILNNTGQVVKPVEISIVKLPVGTKVRKSVARPQDWPGQAHQPGGAIQFEIRDNPKIDEFWFKPMGKISDYLN